MAPSTESFSFHCTICYESLNTTDRAPVVLPCGHTFLCELCAKRLDKCMECRTPLSTAAPRPSQPPGRGPSLPPLGSRPLDRSRAYLQKRRATSHSTLRSNYSARSSASVAPPAVAPPAVAEAPERIPLPIPRNQVLMSLIKSVQDSANENEKDGYKSGDDDGLVLDSVRYMRPSTGTYVVREKNGLTVYAQKEADNVNEWSCCTGHFFNVVEAPMSEVKRLVYNQKVELVSFEGYVAVVGGGAGFITVDNRAQLVKVGEAKEEICKLESAHAGLLEQLKKLERKKKRTEKAESAMAQKVKEALKEMESLDSFFGPEPPWEKLPEEETMESTERSHFSERLSPELSVRDAPPPLIGLVCEQDGKVDLSPAALQTKSAGLSEPQLPEEETMETSERSLLLVPATERLSPESPVSVRDAPPPVSCEYGMIKKKINFLFPATEQTKSVGLSEPRSLEKKLGGLFDSFFSGCGDHGVSDSSEDIDFATTATTATTTTATTGLSSSSGRHPRRLNRSLKSASFG